MIYNGIGIVQNNMLEDDKAILIMNEKPIGILNFKTGKLVFFAKETSFDVMHVSEKNANDLKNLPCASR